MGSGSMGSTASTEAEDLKRRRKKLRERLRGLYKLQAQAENGRSLSSEEAAKVAQRDAWEAQLSELDAQCARLQAPLPAVEISPPASTAAGTFIAARTNLRALEPPTVRPATRANAELLRAQLADMRAAFEREQEVRQQELQAAELLMWNELRDPVASWAGDAVWQLAMCEFADEAPPPPTPPPRIVIV